ncbi:MAG: divalent-cation tolerance protein CutA [Phreatobacter sp.]|uniref:divalent-cation tolerance protein CutA n=1 Tax=Phreatobacter sp. TaxID=1966341 RepID=UPI001A5AAF1D|nr:divalent-cation tolerance protein CutA [Phreatobacter sp.]MBL8568249.1 divalent-cation tolerance protein CutA [Phreatobacter sp.]
MTPGTAPDDVVLIYTTAGTLVEAEAIGALLVEGRHAACVNILPQMRSIYRWNGAVERSDEAVMIVKTTRAKLEPARIAFRAAHSYETPAFLVIEVPEGDADYLAWLRGQVA